MFGLPSGLILFDTATPVKKGSLGLRGVQMDCPYWDDIVLCINHSFEQSSDGVAKINAEKLIFAISDLISKKS